MSNIRLLNCSKLVINRKNNNDATFCCYDALLKDFWRCFVSFFKINYWFKFHVWYRSGLGLSCLVLELCKFSFIKDWPEFRISQYTPVQVFFNIWRLGWVRDTKFGTNVSKEILLNAAKRHRYSLYYFWVIKVTRTR